MNSVFVFHLEVVERRAMTGERKVLAGCSLPLPFAFRVPAGEDEIAREYVLAVHDDIRTGIVKFLEMCRKEVEQAAAERGAIAEPK